MARGWESKSVEDQVAEAQTGRQAQRTRGLTADEIELQKRKQALLLERTRIIREMERAYKRRHLEILERGLAHIEAELAKLNN